MDAHVCEGNHLPALQRHPEIQRCEKAASDQTATKSVAAFLFSVLFCVALFP